MNTLFSQRDPAYSSIKLGSTTIGKDGCVVMSLATLFQVDPTFILSIQGAFNKKGECDIKKVVEFLGGTVPYRGKLPPIGWCLAKTGHYAKAGVPTHFFPYNAQTKQAIDPLQHPTSRQENIYSIDEYIWISDVVLDFTKEDLQKKLDTAVLAFPKASGQRFKTMSRFIERVKSMLKFF